jgi:hypothetical protein
MFGDKIPAVNAVCNLSVCKDTNKNFKTFELT